ncbi:MAG: thiamine-monophosphate kinase [Verrucomicrobiae bacterium]|nr:thiamine-monophosphate kinase [Verrucomicrobiae bacterium]
MQHAAGSDATSACLPWPLAPPGAGGVEIEAAHGKLAEAEMEKQDEAVRLSEIGEFGWIRRIARGRRAGRGVVLGIGDDAAVVRPSGGKKRLLITCDPVIEGVHFDSTATDEQIGWKAMMRNVSDLAAMGGEPRWALVSAALPRDFPLRRALAIQRGLDRAARRFGVTIVGGDTARRRGALQITVTALGEAPAREVTTRAGARPGHALFVTGSLGGSRQRKHRTFVPRVTEARFLASRGFASAMMDLSDGLAGDLERLRERSEVGFEIFFEKLPVSAAARRAEVSRAGRVRRAMEDGEDYELVFTTPRSKVARLRREWARRFRLRLTEIGVVREKKFGIRRALAPGWRAASLFPGTIRAAYDHFLVPQSAAGKSGGAARGSRNTRVRPGELRQNARRRAGRRAGR